MESCHKEELLKFMHASGFDWICDIALFNNKEIVASKRKDGTLWWRNLEVEGSGFTRLFQNSVRSVMNQVHRKSKDT